MKRKHRIRLLGMENCEIRSLLAANLFAADFNSDQAVDASDIDMLVANVRSGMQNPEFDLTQDGQVSVQDVDYLVESLLGTKYGDADLDRDVDLTDFFSVAENYGQEAGWSGGNFDLGPQVGFSDFLTLARSFGFRATTFAYTMQSMDGNRFVEGWGKLPEATPIDIPLDFAPKWVLGIPSESAQAWVAVGEAGEAQAFRIESGVATEVHIEPSPLDAGVPPLLMATGDRLAFVTAPGEAAKSPTHPLRFGPDADHLAYVNVDGSLVVESGDDSQTFEINALPDARIVSDGKRLLLLTQPTTQYAHGVLGDRVEAAGLTMVDLDLTPPRITTFAVPEDQVIEGISPIWTDIDDDGTSEIIVTLSNNRNGGQITLYDEQGQILAQGPGIGQGFRWRHQLAVAPFGPNREIELVDVLTPHIGGVVEFRAIEGQSLTITGSVPGFTSHVIRTRNLDMAAAADFDSDGAIELILPDQRRTRLGAISRIPGGAQVDWELPLGGILGTNVSVLRRPNGILSLGVGLTNGVLRVWN